MRTSPQKRRKAYGHTSFNRRAYASPSSMRLDCRRTGTSLLTRQSPRKPEQPERPSIKGAFVLGTMGAALFSLPPAHDSMVRLAETIVQVPLRFVVSYAMLCGLIVASNRLIENNAHRISDERTREFVRGLDPGLIIMSAGASVAGIEMLYNVNDVAGKAFQHASGDLILSGAFITSILAFKRLSGTASVFKGAERVARAICYIDDALHPILAMMRWGIL